MSVLSFAQFQKEDGFSSIIPAISFNDFPSKAILKRDSKVSPSCCFSDLAIDISAFLAKIANRYLRPKAQRGGHMPKRLSKPASQKTRLELSLQERLIATGRALAYITAELAKTDLDFKSTPTGVAFSDPWASEPKLYVGVSVYVSLADY